MAGTTPILVHNCPNGDSVGRGRVVTDASKADGVWQKLGFSSRSAFGKAVWGVGEKGAVQMGQEMTVEDLQEIGLTQDGAQAWADYYSEEYAANPRNGTAGARATLMSQYADMLGG